MMRYIKDVLTLGDVVFIQLAVALQETKQGTAYTGLTLLTGDILVAN